MKLYQNKPSMLRSAKEARQRAIKQLEEQLKSSNKPYKVKANYPLGTEFIKASGEERIIGVKLSDQDKKRINKELETLKTRI